MRLLFSAALIGTVVVLAGLVWSKDVPREPTANADLSADACPAEIYGGSLTEARYNFFCGRLNAVDVTRSFDKTYESELTDTFSEGGLFEVLINNAWIDLNPTICPTIAIRMIWSDFDLYQDEINNKRAFFEDLQRHLDGDSSGIQTLHVAVSSDSLLHPTHHDTVVDEESLHDESCLMYFVANEETGAIIE